MHVNAGTGSRAQLYAILVGAGYASIGCGNESGRAGPASTSGATTSLTEGSTTGGGAPSSQSVGAHSTGEAPGGVSSAGAAGASATLCPAGLDDCDDDPVNGCETSIDVDNENCGACGAVGGADHAEATCEGGACRLVCESGFSDCNGIHADGCEILTATSQEHCGGCEQVCDLPNLESQECVAGTCAITSCRPAHADCNGRASDGCEAALDDDARNCGWCGHSCGSSSCESGACWARQEDSGFGFATARTRLVRYDAAFRAILEDVASQPALWRTGPGEWDVFYGLYGAGDSSDSLAGDGDPMYWSDPDGSVFRADSTHPDGWVIADLPSAARCLALPAMHDLG